MDSTVDALITSADRGDRSAADALFDALYLATDDPALAELVDLKFFCGFSFAEIAAMRGVSERTVQRSWDKSRLYLFRSITGGDPRA
jgi:DNA-directed RNA polymerase specialized sigma24 family protein